MNGFALPPDVTSEKSGGSPMAGPMSSGTAGWERWVGCCFRTCRMARRA